MSIHRRLLLKTTAAGGALAAFAAGFSETGRKLVKGAWAGERPENAVSGNAPKPEFRIDPATGNIVLTPGQIVAYTGCIGCTTLCGVRVRVDTEKNKVLRVAGNPYTPMSTDPFLPYGTPVRESFKALSRFQEKGLDGRSTACGRGNAVLENVTSSFRVTTPLKRVGPRGSGRWEPIAFDQLVGEVCGGGDLFGEGHVDGLAALRDLKTPIDPATLELGTRVNQVAMITGVPDGRESLVQRFLQQAYGSINYVGHGSYCGGAYRAGSGAVFGDTKQQPHAKPDIANAEFVVFIGTAPSNAGNPFKRQATLISKARTDGALRYVVVDPVLTNARAAAAGERADWIPIRPGTDGAFAMGIIRWMFENGRIDERYLSQPNGKAAEAVGEAGWCNATHLVVVQKGHPREGRLLRASDLGWVTLDEKDRYGEKDAFVVLDPATTAPVTHDALMTAATLFHEGTVTAGTEDIAVKTGLTLLREEAMLLDLRAYSDACGVPADVIAGLAHELTSHGKKSAVNSHGGMMSGSGFYNAFAVVTINTLLGNLNWKGGTIVGGGRFLESGDGPRYKLSSFPGRVKPSGIPLGRNVPYEKTSEFRAKKAAGKPYPARAPWYPTAPGLTTEWMSSGIADGYPYPVKALLLWNANPVYGIPGAHRFAQKLADPKTVPLVVAIDPFINETSALADYIVPDTVLYETWGWTSAWGGVPTKMTTARWPVLVPRTDKLPDGQPIQLEPFLIALAKRLDLPGFGPDAIEGMDGTRHPLETAEDWHLRAGANVAWLGKQPVPDASDEDIAFSGVGRVLPALKATLKEEEWRKVAFVLARGGRYQNQVEGFEGEKATHRFAKPLQIYNEAVGTSKSSITGRRWPGTAAWMPPVFADGTPVSHVYRPEDWPFQLVSSKSVLVSAYTIGATRLRHLHPENPVGVNADDARRLGIRTGDRIRIATPGGAELATAIVRHGVMPGVLAVEHGFGHKEFGARAHVIGDRRQPDVPEIAAGINLNDLGLADPTRTGASVWVDPVAGTAVRQGIPARLERTAAA